MAIEGGITEIPDSEDELMTSSPTVTEHQVDNLAPTPCDSAHTSQEMQRGARSQQVSIEHVPTLASSRDENMATEQGPSPPKIEMANPKHDNISAQQPVIDEANVIQAEPLQERETPLKSNINEQRHDTDSSDEQLEQSTHYESTQGGCAEDEGSSESNSLHIEPTARAWDENRGAVKEMQLSEAIRDGVVPSGPSQSAERQSASSPEPNTKVSAETTQSFKKGEPSRNKMSEYADTDTTSQETIDPGSFANTNPPEAGLTEPAAKVYDEPIEESGPVLVQQQQQTGQKSSHATEDLATFTGSMQQQRDDGRAEVPERQTLSHLKNSAHGDPDLTDTMKMMDVPTERILSTKPHSADIDLETSSMKQIHCQGRINDEATSRLDLKHETEESGGNLNKPSQSTNARSHLVDEHDEQRIMHVETLAPQVDSNTRQVNVSQGLPVNSTHATATSKLNETAGSEASVETPRSPKLSDTESHSLEAFPRGHVVDEPDRMNIDGIFPTTGQNSLPEASAKGAAVQNSAVMTSAYLPQERDDWELKTDDQKPQKHIQLQQQQQHSPPTKAAPSQKKLSPVRDSQKATIADLRAQKATLIASLAALPNVLKLIAENENEDDNDNTLSQASEDESINASIMIVANKIVKAHIKLLHEYNEMKDVGQGLMGLIADSRGVRIVEVQDEFGIESND